MKKKYVLTREELFELFGYRVGQVKEGTDWFYKPNKRFPYDMSPKHAADATELPIEVFEEAFKERFGEVEIEVVDYRLDPAKKEAIIERYPNARFISFKDKYGHSPVWFGFNKIKKKLCEPSMTSCGDNVIRPLWFSVLSDLGCVFTLGLIQPRRRPGEKCLGDLEENS